uniref:Putative NBS-LRR class RGA n=1 Tax=Oryza barthii TaxID=65489 RepID=A0A679BDP9_9ORYZ|nr:putative NBS-LRR class RGA [Oryza barthii]
MANPWKVAAMGATISICGWFISPIISLVVNKIISYIGFDWSGELEKLKRERVPKLKELLSNAEVHRMLAESRNDVDADHVARLEDMVNRLRSALYEADDILDLVEYYRLKKKVLGESGSSDSSTWLQLLHGYSRRVHNALLVPAAPVLRRWYAAMRACVARTKIALRLPTSTSVRGRRGLLNSLRNCGGYILTCPSKVIMAARSLRSFFCDAATELFNLNYQQANDTMSRGIPPDMSKLRLKIILNKIENIICEADKQLPHLDKPPNKVTDAIPPPAVIGRDNDRDNIIAMLHENVDGVQPGSSNSVLSGRSIIGIHGISGSGKSTLAQHICDHLKKDKQEENDCHFDLIMWVHVSENFDVVDIFSKILKEATKLNTEEHDLEKALSEKRFLLVLDDVWSVKVESHQSKEMKDKIVSLLKAGKAGSKILATSQTDKALLALGAAKERCILISEMGDTVFLELFMHYALDGVDIDEQDRRAFEVIGAQIANKLKGSPLAATIVGARLRQENLNYWISFNDQKHLGDVMDFLKWSYQQLDEEARRCFAYCSIFPRRYQLQRGELVKLWVAQGFITTTNGDKKEIDAERHFDHLVSVLFLRPVNDDYSGHIAYFTMHDLLYDLAKMVVGSECYTVQKGWAGDLPQNVRHLFIEIDGEENMSKKVLELENLRTLIIIHTQDTEKLLVEDVLECMFTNLRMLRALILKVELQSFKGGRQIFIPESIGELLHLRYFYLSKALYSKVIFPRRFARLYHMEVVNVGYSEWGKVEFSSGEDTTNLINLRVVPYDAEFDFPFVGRMESLQTLHKFTVKRETGYELFQLKKLNKLKHLLKIDGLENVPTKEDAHEAELHNKSYIRGLKLTWNPSGETSVQDQDLQSEVIQALRPPTHLQTLAIESYNGSSYPSWMMDGGPEVLMCLRDLMLIDCTELGSVPEQSVLFKYLHSLQIIRCNWRYFPDNMEHLKSLVELVIQNCSEILSLPTLPQSLQQFKIKNCDAILSLPTLPQSLKELITVGCYKLELLPTLPPSLQKLKTKYCNAILSLPTLPQSLKELIIVGCKNLESLPTLPQSLKELMIEDCKNINSLPTLPQSLQKLMLYRFRNIDLPTMPQSLELFDVLTNDQKFARSCETVGEENWEKIRHIPTRNINYDEYYVQGNNFNPFSSHLFTWITEVLLILTYTCCFRHKLTQTFVLNIHL